MNFQDASNLRIPEGYVRTIHDKNNRLLWGSVGYDVSFDGNATQTTYSGKNLWDGVFGQGRASTASAYHITSTQSPLLESGTTYTVSLSSVPSGMKYAVALYTAPAYPESHPGASVYDSGWQTDASFTFTAGGDYYFSVVMAKIDGSAVTPSEVSNVNFQLEVGSTATDFQPFVGGTASPNPDYPQAISTVTGENTVKIAGKNLLSLTPYRTGSDWYNLSAGAQVIPAISSDITLTPIQNGVQATLSSSWQGAWYICEVAEGQTYTFKYSQSGTSARTTVYTLDENHTIVRKIAPIASDNYTYQNAITIADGEKYFALAFGASANGSVVELTEPQLELGSQATSYQAYTAQDYEVNLGFNQFTSDGATAGARISVSNGGTYASTDYSVSDYIPVTAGHEYVLTTGGTSYFSWYNSSKTYISGTSWTSGGTKTAPTNAGYIRFDYKTADVAGVRFDIPLELAKIGTYQDRIYKDGEKWYVEKQTGKIIFDGSEAFYSSGQYTNAPNYCVIQTRTYDSILGAITPSLCDHFIGYSDSALYTGMPAFDEARISIGSGGTYKTRLAVPTSMLDMTNTGTQASSFATWLSTHPTTVYYALATPTVTEITDATLIAQLEAVYDWVRRHGYNASVTGDLPIIINRTALPTA